MEDWLKCQISPLVKYRQNQIFVSELIADHRLQGTKIPLILWVLTFGFGNRLSGRLEI